MERKVINRKHFSFWSLKNWTFSVLSPPVCPYLAENLEIHFPKGMRVTREGGEKNVKTYLLPSQANPSYSTILGMRSFLCHEEA